MKKLIKWGLLIGWMVIIFVYSSQPAVVSDEKSRFVIYIFSKVGLNLNSYFGDLADFVVRKAAHFSEYCIFFMLVYNVVYEAFSLKKALLLSVVVAFLYACTDEFHQTFIPGREGRFRDVLIDTSGAATGALFFYIHNVNKNKVKNDKKRGKA